MNPRASDLINTLGLRPHPEGGWFCESFRSGEQVTCPDDRGQRSALTAIYFLLKSNQHSQWHRVRSDEVWVHLEGDALDLWSWDCVRKVALRTVLGPVDVTGGQRPQHTIAAGVWQAAKPSQCSNGGHHHGFTLVSCMVGPGFDFADFTLLEAGDEETVQIHFLNSLLVSDHTTL